MERETQVLPWKVHAKNLDRVTSVLGSPPLSRSGVQSSGWEDSLFIDLMNEGGLQEPVDSFGVFAPPGGLE